MPDSPIYYKCVCQNCAGHIEFPASAAGTTVPCPHCKFETLLEGPPPPVATKKTSPLVWIILALVISLGGAAVLFAPKIKAKLQESSLSQKQTPPPVARPIPAPPAPDPWHGLKAGPVQLVKADTGNLLYAIGTLHNDSDHNRYGVKVEINLFDEQKNKIETTTDYTASITPGKEWKFRALVLKHNATRAELVKVTEEK